ncbi:helix-turn-helix domain-containing protein [Pseudoalteromonas rubra]|uniref:Helix-turn-helix domain-containing protein n=1 Tax=Pseudoalteromonas rubra TaxID=43658 RepID=A0A5S3UT94_9GAMM|nr:helix-turn-helix transcriptional regulator [Pseudoalteromonas rubra]QPB82808.1 helix-turn-helix domain-containing protein [Pseudoalteromonas rubra]
MTGGEILKAARSLRGMTQDEVVAMYGGISRNIYQRWEGGRTAAPYDDVKAIVEQVYKLNLANLLAMVESNG